MEGFSPRVLFHKDTDMMESRDTFEDAGDESGEDDGVSWTPSEAPHIHSKKGLLGHLWVGALVMQLVCYATLYICATKDPLVGSSSEAGTDAAAADAADAAAADAEEGAEPQRAGNFEMFVYFGTFSMVVAQIREIPRHMEAASDNEAEWVDSDMLVDKLKALKRIKWHQRARHLSPQSHTPARFFTRVFQPRGETTYLLSR